MSYEAEQMRLTLEHVRLVGAYLQHCASDLDLRAIEHDKSKFGSEEWPGFLEMTEKLKGCTYGSPEYQEYLKQLQPTLEHHYAANRHHPEHFLYYECNGCFTRYTKCPNSCERCGYTQFTTRPDVSRMSLLDLIEMVCDWLAATQRHDDGDIWKSIEINQKRFEYSDELKEILKNTVKELVQVKEKQT